MNSMSEAREKQYLFGWDGNFAPNDNYEGRGRLFWSLFIDKTTNESVNHNRPEDINGKPALDVMQVRNYTQKPQSDAADTDIHNEFIDFILNMAHYHKALDSYVFRGVYKPTWAAFNFIGQVYVRWSSFNHDSTRKFFKHYLDFMKSSDGTNWQVISESEYEKEATIAVGLKHGESPVSGNVSSQPSGGTISSPCDTAKYPQMVNYRVNFKKLGTTSVNHPDYNLQEWRITLFVNAIPQLYNPSSANVTIWYTKYDNDVRGYNVTDKLYLRKLFACLFYSSFTSCRATGSNSLPNYESAHNIQRPYNTQVHNRFENLWVAKLIRRRLKHWITHSNQQVPAIGVNDQVFDFITMNVWKNDYSSGNPRLYTEKTDSSGNVTRVYVDDLDDERKYPDFEKNCYTLGIHMNDARKCEIFVLDCILGNKSGLNECLGNNPLQPNDFLFSMNPAEFNKFDSSMVLKTLKWFGFKKGRVNDLTYGGQLYKMEPVSRWLKNTASAKFIDPTSSGSTTTFEQHISKNNSMIQWLSILVDLINKNPAILNPEFSGSSDESVGKHTTPSYAQLLGTPMRKKPTSKNNFLSGFDRLASTMKARHLYARSSSHLKPYNFNNYINALYGLPKWLHGGGNKQGGSKMKYDIIGGGNTFSTEYTKALNNGTAGSSLLQNIFNSIFSSLNNIHPLERKRINEAIKNMKENELKVLKSMVVFETYNKICSEFDEECPKQRSITEKTAERTLASLSHLSEKYAAQELNVLRLLKSFLNLQNGISDDFTEAEYDEELNPAENTYRQ